MVVVWKEAPSSDLAGFQSCEQFLGEFIHPLPRGSNDGLMLVTGGCEVELASATQRVWRCVPRPTLDSSPLQDILLLIGRHASPCIHEVILNFCAPVFKLTLWTPALEFVVRASARSEFLKARESMKNGLKAELQTQAMVLYWTTKPTSAPPPKPLRPCSIPCRHLSRNQAFHRLCRRRWGRWLG